MSDNEMRRYRSDDRDLQDHDLDLVILPPDGNGDWYVSVLPHGHKIGPTVRVTTSGTPANQHMVPVAVAKLYQAMGGEPLTCSMCSTIKSRPTPILCVAGLVLDGDRVALIRSAKPGRAWELPGGKLQPGEDWRAALSREIREETGLRIAPRAWSVVDVLSGQPTPGAEFPSTIVVARAAARGELEAGDDAAEVRWFDRGGLPSALSALETRKTLRVWSKGTDDFTDAVLAYCDAVNGDLSTTAAALFEDMERIARGKRG